MSEMKDRKQAEQKNKTEKKILRRPEYQTKKYKRSR